MTTRSVHAASRLFGAAALLGGSLVAPAAAQVTQRVSVGSDGQQALDASSGPPSISADGRYVAFASLASNLAAGDVSWRDVFVRDRLLGLTECMSVDPAGGPRDDDSFLPAISADGRFVAFTSRATNLVAGDTNGLDDVFVRDRQHGTTERASLDSGGAQGNGVSGSDAVSISGDGRYVAFDSSASDLVGGDTNGASDVFVRDRLFGTTERVSVDSTGNQGNDGSTRPWISFDGRYVVFESRASNLVASDTNGAIDVFLRDRELGTTERISVDTAGAEGNGDSARASISVDGRYVAFQSLASDLVPFDTNGVQDGFVRDRLLEATERVSIGGNGDQADGTTSKPRISLDGRCVAFASSASNLVPGDTNLCVDVFLRDRSLGTTELVSQSSQGELGNGTSDDVALSDDGRFVAFVSAASNLVPYDTNASGTNPCPDVFVRDRTGGVGFASLCEPGVGGVRTCPCGNPPGGSGRGCENSAGTGGARLSATGGASLSSDSLVFTTSGEKPTATSVLLQGTASSAGGVVYGQGVRCVGGTLKRLYTKSASGGSITAPSFAAGDATVSARSAAVGNPIASGQSRWYLVFYRDPTVLGGCPSGSTFNATQTGVVTWSP
jgi:Tol biopolymer transport system component